MGRLDSRRGDTSRRRCCSCLSVVYVVLGVALGSLVTSLARASVSAPSTSSALRRIPVDLTADGWCTADSSSYHVSVDGLSLSFPPAARFLATNPPSAVFDEGGLVRRVQELEQLLASKQEAVMKLEVGLESCRSAQAPAEQHAADVAVSSNAEGSGLAASYYGRAWPTIIFCLVFRCACCEAASPGLSRPVRLSACTLV